ncbi:MAG: hypothetical protein R3E84_19190 [Pseudomonadales bacterium]
MRTEPTRYIDRTRDYYAAQGFARPYVWAHFDDIPFTPPGKSLAQSRLAIVTTAALYDRRPTQPREVACAPLSPEPARLFGNDLAWDKEVTHMDDRDSYFPLRELQRAVADGRLGSLTERFYCVPTDYSQRNTSERDAPQILDWCREDGAEIALLVPL